MIVSVYLVMIGALLLFPQICAQAAKEALIVWGLHVTPSLFPYMVLSRMLAERLKKTSLPPWCTCALLGALGGSPSGAALIACAHTRLSAKNILALCAFTGTISPMFFFGTINGWTKDSLLCGQLFLAQFLGAALTAILVRILPFRVSSTKTDDAIKEKNERGTMAQSIDAVLQIGGCIICFSVFAALMSLLPLPQELLPFLHAVLEISGGVHAVIRFPFSEFTRQIILAAVSGFGGLSILSQNLLFLKPAGLRGETLFLLSLIRALFSALVMGLLVML